MPLNGQLEDESWEIVTNNSDSQRPDSDTIRILVSTDNHVGFEERDPIRKDDSWRTFDEVMTIAKERDVDMVLLAGDMFHDNSTLLLQLLHLRTLNQSRTLPKGHVPSHGLT